MRTERILVKPHHIDYKSMMTACRLSKKLFNQALFYKRQAFFNHDKLSFSELDSLMKLKHSELYNALPNAGSQQIIRKLCSDFDSFWASHKNWQKNPGMYEEKPRIPNYKKPRQLKIFLISSQPLAVKNGMIQMPKKMNISPVISRFAEDKQSNKNGKIIKEVRIVPHGSCFWFEISFDESQIKDNSVKHVKLNPNRKLAIDLGINVLMAITSNQAGFNPVLIQGRPIKSLNQYFNKQKAKLMSLGKHKQINKLTIKRFNQINDYFHKCSNKVLQLCLEHDVGAVIIGKNRSWKQNVSMSKKNNQSFVSVPHTKLIEQMRYKLAAYGIELIEQEESYTSKADALMLDNLPVYQQHSNVNHVFSGKRVKRGLYKSKAGKLLHADVNASLNILRKATDDEFVKALVGSGCVFQPAYWCPNRPCKRKSEPLDCASNDNLEKAPSITALAV